MYNFGLEDLKVILRDFGEITFYFSVAFLLPIIISLLYGEGIKPIMYFLIPCAITLAVGFGFKKLFATHKETRKMHAFNTVILVWFLLPLFGAFPYMLHGIGAGDAYFDSVSAFTTTGITPIRNQAGFTNSMMFWRSLEAWIGGAGIILLALVGIFTYIKSYKLYQAEGREKRLRPSVRETAKRIWWIYTVLTVFGVILLLISGMGLFDSVNYSMSAISTNGMDTTWRNLANLNNPATEAALAVIMLLGSFSFYIHYKFLRGKFKAYFGDVQVRLTFILLLLGIMIALPNFMAIYGQTDGIRYAIFHSTSALTAGGFHAADGAQWGSTIKLVLASLMLVGGSAGSTAGGLKLIRFWVFLKSIYWRIKQSVLPERAYFSRKIEGREVEEKEMSTLYFFIILYILIAGIGTLVITQTEGASIGNAMFEVIGAQGNAGLTTGITAPGMNTVSKAMLIINMIVGRIEIIPILYSIGFFMKYKKKPSL